MNFLTPPPGDQPGRPPAQQPGRQPDGAPAAAEPWAAWAPGTRVMVRRRLPDGGAHLFTDVLGTVLSNDEHGLRLLTRTGEVTVPQDQIAVGKPIPPAPPRRRPRTDG